MALQEKYNPKNSMRCYDFPYRVEVELPLSASRRSIMDEWCRNENQTGEFMVYVMRGERLDPYPIKYERLVFAFTIPRTAHQFESSFEECISRRWA